MDIIYKLIYDYGSGRFYMIDHNDKIVEQSNKKYNPLQKNTINDNSYKNKLDLYECEKLFSIPELIEEKEDCLSFITITQFGHHVNKIQLKPTKNREVIFRYGYKRYSCDMCNHDSRHAYIIENKLTLRCNTHKLKSEDLDNANLYTW